MPAGPTDPARTPGTGSETAGGALLEAPRGEGPDIDRCPSCDTPGAWRLSRRHRYSPFGAVTLVVVSFWTALLGWLLGFGYMPSLVLLVLGVYMGLATRTAEVCQVCGFVRPRRRT